MFKLKKSSLYGNLNLGLGHTPEVYADASAALAAIEEKYHGALEEVEYEDWDGDMNDLPFRFLTDETVVRVVLD